MYWFMERSIKRNLTQILKYTCPASLNAIHRFCQVSHPICCKLWFMMSPNKNCKLKAWVLWRIRLRTHTHKHTSQLFRTYHMYITETLLDLWLIWSLVVQIWNAHIIDWFIDYTRQWYIFFEEKDRRNILASLRLLRLDVLLDFNETDFAANEPRCHLISWRTYMKTYKK